jgi:hypothetical protein
MIIAQEASRLNHQKRTRAESDGTVITSDSTLRFRSREEITNSLREVGMSLDEVREAPDRPGREFVFIARRPTT